MSQASSFWSEYLAIYTFWTREKHGSVLIIISQSSLITLHIKSKVSVNLFPITFLIFGLKIMQYIYLLHSLNCWPSGLPVADQRGVVLSWLLKIQKKWRKCQDWIFILWSAMVNFSWRYCQKRLPWQKLYQMKVKEPFAVDPLNTLSAVVISILAPKL